MRFKEKKTLFYYTIVALTVLFLGIFWNETVAPVAVFLKKTTSSLFRELFSPQVIFILLFVLVFVELVITLEKALLKLFHKNKDKN